MGDKVIRINSVQGFADSFTNTAPSSILNLCDFVIPRGLTVDLGKSYVAFNTQINSAEALAASGVGAYNNNLFLDVDNDEKFNVPNSALIRTARMTCDRGQVESIRRLDTLSTALWGVSGDAEDKKSDMNVFGDFENGRGVGNKTSYFLDTVVNNSAPDGSLIADLKSKQAARDIKIPIKDIFNGVGDVDDWSTDVFGETRIHLETNWNKVYSYPLGGAEGTSQSFDVTTNWGAMDDKLNLANGAVITSVDTTVVYTAVPGKGGQFEYTLPYHVGQKVVISGTTAPVAGGAGTPMVPGSLANNLQRIIKQIEFLEGAGTGKCRITFDDTIWQQQQAAAQSVTAIRLDAVVDQVNTVVVNSAQLVLYTVDSEEPSENYSYKTWTTEEDNGNGLQNFNRQYIVEPECVNLIVAHANNGAILPNRSYVDYRIAIDNVDQTGNRSVAPDSPLQYDRLQRCLVENADIEWNNAQMKFYKNTETQANALQSPISIIAETMPITMGFKKVGLEMNAAGAGNAGIEQLVLYKQITKTI
tara:strand:+ start:358 stop:1947 length:1590 start_codon:yes stop_codon:yes gene_type:complete